MGSYTFYFRFLQLDPDRQVQKVETWGGHLGTALNRAWKSIKANPKYKDIKNLRPTCIDIGPKDVSS